MTIDATYGAINVLLVEDNPADIRLLEEALKSSNIRYRFNVAMDGEQAMNYLRRPAAESGQPVPDLIILDLNLPRKDGREVLSEVKQDERLKHIPVVVLTTSESSDDIIRCYRDHANCYLTKPLNLDKFDELVRLIEMFWFITAKLPKRG
jgi:CheY-like chemotaxis protein